MKTTAPNLQTPSSAQETNLLNLVNPSKTNPLTKTRENELASVEDPSSALNYSLIQLKLDHSPQSVAQPSPSAFLSLSPTKNPDPKGLLQINQRLATSLLQTQQAAQQTPPAPSAANATTQAAATGPNTTTTPLPADNSTASLASNSTSTSAANATSSATTPLDDLPAAVVSSINIDYNIFYGFFPDNQTSTIETIIILFSLLIFIRIVLGYLPCENKFFSRTIPLLVSSTYPYFFYLCFFFVIFAVIFAEPSFTWGGVLCGLIIFFFVWMIFSFLLIFFCYLMAQKWEMLEKNAVSFSTIKSEYDRYMTTRLRLSHQPALAEEHFFELAEYLTLKTYFTNPFFSMFKAMTLRKDFNFAQYLQLSLIKQLGSFYNLTIFSWVVMLCAILCWHVFISNTSETTKFVLMSTLPLLILLYLLLVYFYLQRLYRKIVPEINETNIIDFKDPEKHDPSSVISSLTPPVYLKQYYEKPAPMPRTFSQLKAPNAPQYYNHNLHSAEREQAPLYTYSLTEHLLGRPPSLFEDTILCGVSGKYLLHNSLQSALAVFLSYLTIVLLTEGAHFHRTLGAFALPLLGALALLYLTAFCYLLAVSLRWFVVCAATEMNRDEKVLKQALAEQRLAAAETAEGLFTSFKKLYFDMMVNINLKSVELGLRAREAPAFNSLGKAGLLNLVDAQLLRFKARQLAAAAERAGWEEPRMEVKIELNARGRESEGEGEGEELRGKDSRLGAKPGLKRDFRPVTAEQSQMSASKGVVVITEELKSFLAVCGNKLSNAEIEFMLHLVENLDSTSSDVLTVRQLYDVAGAVLHFAGKLPHEILAFVFERYYEERRENKNEYNLILSEGKVVEFFAFYREYFDEQQVAFAIAECGYLGKEFSLDLFIASVVAMRSYYPN